MAHSACSGSDHTTNRPKSQVWQKIGILQLGIIIQIYLETQDLTAKWAIQMIQPAYRL